MWRLSILLMVFFGSMISIYSLFASCFAATSSLLLMRTGVKTTAYVQKSGPPAYRYAELDYYYMAGTTKFTGSARVAPEIYNYYENDDPMAITYIPSKPYMAARDPQDDLHSAGHRAVVGAIIGAICLGIFGTREKWEPWLD